MGHRVEMTPKKRAAYLAALKGSGKLPYTDLTADEEAKRRWGESGRAWHPAYTKRGERFYCTVGAMVGETRDEWQVFGRGESWEKAFEDAQARGH